MRAVWLAACVALCTLVAGCGGGGGDGGSGGVAPPGNSNPGNGNGNGGGGGGGGGGSTYSVNVNPASIQFTSNVRESAPPPQTVIATFVGEGLVVGYAPGVQQAGWLKMDVVSPSQFSPVHVRFSINTTGTFTRSLSLSTSIRFASGRADGSQVVVQDVPVTFTVRDPFAIGVANVELDADEGANSNTLTVPVYGENIQWTATADQPWVHLAPASAPSAGQIAVSASAASLPAGTHTAQVRLTDSVSGDVLTLPVTFYVAANRWSVNRTGLLLLGFSDAASPSQSVRVTNSRNVSSTWTASSDASWLAVTASGTHGDLLTVQTNGNATSLAADTVHIGTVTVTGAGLQNDQLRVGYYRSSQTLPSQLAGGIPGLGGATRPLAVVADPIRPFAYVAFGTDSVFRVNFTTGAVDELMKTTGTIFISPVVSGDGRFLYVMNATLPGGIHVLDLDTMQPLAPWPRGALCCGGDERAFTRTRSRNVTVEVNVNLEVRNATTGVLSPPRVPTVDFTNFNSMLAVGDGSIVYNFGSGNSACHRADRYQLATRPATGQGFLSPAASFDATAPDDNGCVTVKDIAPSFDDTVRYFVGFRANGYSRLFRRNGDGTITEINRQFDYYVLKMSDSGRKFVSYRGPSAHHARLFNADDSVATDLGNYYDIHDVAFAADERFGLVLGQSNVGSPSGGLFIYRLP